jgi:hypothetical protein
MQMNDASTASESNFIGTLNTSKYSASWKILKSQGSIKDIAKPWEAVVLWNLGHVFYVTATNANRWISQ